MPTLLQAALAALVATAAPEFDTVLLQDGGRVLGTVIEETRATGVTVLLPDGRTRTLSPGEVFRVEYRDGTIGIVGGPRPPAGAPANAPVPSTATSPPEGTAPVPPPATPAPPGAPDDGPVPPGPVGEVAPPPPPAQPPPPPAWRAPVRRPLASPPSLFMLAAGFGLAVPAGSAEPGLPMRDVLAPQALFELEAGLRFTPELMGSLVFDVGVGDAAGPQLNACRAAFGGSSCSGVAVRFALQLRYAFTPFARATPWVALGVGAEASGVSAGQSSSGSDLIWSGVEFPRLSVGYDVRSGPVVGWGVFATVGVGRYDQVDDGGTVVTLDHRATHAWFQAGFRIILGP